MVKVLSLFSGSLASRVAARLVERHPDVESMQLLHFRSPFSRECEELRPIVKSEWPRMTFRTQSIKKEYQDLIELTDCGEFSLSGSCSNCQYLLMSKAARYMERIDADYLVTGWVPGSHGMTLDEGAAIARTVGLTGRLLHPLSQVNPLELPENLASWTKARSRRKSPDSTMLRLSEWADALELVPSDPMASPCRCKLTTPGFGERVASLFREKVVTLNSMCLLDFPMYLKVEPDLQIVLAFDEMEKRELQNFYLPKDLRVYPSTPHGPMTLLRTAWDAKSAAEKREIVEFVARLTATYTELEGQGTVPVYCRLECEDERQLLNVEPFDSIEAFEAREDVEHIPLELPSQRVVVT